MAQTTDYLSNVRKEHEELTSELREAKLHLRLAVAEVETWRHQVIALESEANELAQVIKRQSQI